MSAKITIELSNSDVAELQAKADALSISLSEATARYVAYCLDHDRWFGAEVQKGIDDIEAGRILTHEEVVQRANDRRVELLARKPQS